MKKPKLPKKPKQPKASASAASWERYEERVKDWSKRIEAKLTPYKKALSIKKRAQEAVKRIVSKKV
ncbi:MULTISPECIES: hypothetical protein [Leptospira]|uniref:Uncharacterized protein n=1 Tax=Leptospira bouyouniensis TaxID=2484911 RepID=A0ABY2LCJ8_9LEPT|nr:MULTISPECIES: hypothetical protein [Leptospira]PKA08658.1 hypothetical protein CH366_02480 [Leptospira harrisiae]TGK53226.1 hypothetical protein EHQ10_05655 [Leptospira bouyouniensis]